MSSKYLYPTGPSKRANMVSAYEQNVIMDIITMKPSWMRDIFQF